jgi:antitoxin component YwqK of YwqJK toxin-antitoxin module
MHPRSLLLLTLLPLSLIGQQKKEFFNSKFKPSTQEQRYYVTTEFRAGKWYREAWYIPEKSMAMTGWYKDEECNMADSIVTWYYANQSIKSIGNYKNGVKEGVWTEYFPNKMMSDSSYYLNGHLLGVSLGWNTESYQVDSSVYDGKGNGVTIHWYEKGPLYYTGYFVNDTSRAKKWSYYHKNGQKLAIEEYINGKRITVACFSENGEQLPECEEKEAYFPGEEAAWRKFLERNLKADVPVKNKAPVGKYTTYVQFVVNTEGQVTDIIPLTAFGYGMEEEVIRIMKRCPRWVPAVQFGRKVKAYRKQPVTFMVTSN